LDVRSIRYLKPIAQPEEDRQSLINGVDLLLRELTEHAPDPSLVD
jgi:hypothetical protein